MTDMRSERGFSLIEVLVVMAISVILVGLVLAPVVQSFRMTRQAQAMIDAQDAARLGMEQISRELGEAMFVFDNSVRPVSIFGATQGMVFRNGQEGPIQLPVRQFDNRIEWFTLPHGKIDFILPKISMHCNNPAHPSGKPRDYPRYVVQGGRKYFEAWPPCPVCKSTDLTAAPRIPLEQDVTVVRYFLGTRYNNPAYDPAANPKPTLPPGEGFFGWRSPWEGEVEPGDENQVVLYRVEFNPYDDTLFPAGMSIQERLTDPIFFYRQETCKAWTDISRVIGIGKYQDLVVGTFDGSGDCIAVEPSVTFRFQAINNDAFEGAYTEDRGFDYPNAIPTAYLASYGYWIDADGITVYRARQQGRTEQTDAFTTEYVTVGGAPHLMIVKRMSKDGWSSAVNQFDITDYLDGVRNGTLTALTKPGSGEPPEMAFTLDVNKGKVNFSLEPPRPDGKVTSPVIELDPEAINIRFHNVYEGFGGPADRGSARRMAPLGLVGNARIVPGSERVIAPNMTPGPGYGRLIRYERVPLALGDPGLNQYKINYDTGDIEFSSDYAQDLPEIPVNPQQPGGPKVPIKVDYKIQLNQEGDVVKGDYTTKSLITVHMGIRMFDPETGKNHQVDVTNSVKVRNAHR